jgi:hypothetical protein
MTNAAVLSVLRRILSEVDLTISDLTDEELLAEISDARDLLELRKVSGMDGLVVGYDQSQSGYGIVPDPTLEQGHMLALAAAIRLLNANFRSRTSRGELGTSWESGLEAESTISAAKVYEQAIQGLQRELDALVLIKRAPTAGTRPV